MRGSRLLARIVPEPWGTLIGAFRRMLALRQQVALGALVVAAVVTEAFGLFLLLPILGFIEGGGDAAALAQNSRFWRFVTGAFGTVGLPVNLITLCCLVFVLVILREIASYTRLMYTAHLKETAAKRLRIRLFEAIMASSGENVRSVGSGAFSSAIVTHSQSAAAVIPNLATVASLCLAILAYAAGALALAPVTMLAVTVFALLAMRATRRHVRRSKELGHEVLRNAESLTQYVLERYRGWQTLKLLNALKAERAELDKRIDPQFRIFMEKARISGSINLIYGPVVALLLLTGLYVSVTHLSLRLSDIALFVLIMLRVVPLAQNFTRTQTTMSTIFAAIRRVDELIGQAAAHRESPGGSRDFVRPEKDISFEAVTFRYRGSADAALAQVSCVIPARVITAIVGPSGSGKSTLVSLIPRLFVPESGCIRLDGIAIEEYSLKSLRDRVAFVPQTPLLMQGTIRENLLLARPDASDADLAEACKLAHADGFVAQLPQGLDTPLGEGGGGLSGGQRQRIAIAQAFLARASILILDEPTSGLDYEAESNIRRAIHELCDRSKMTVIIIAHGAATVSGADYVIVLRDGRVAEAGKPHELAARGDWYRGFVGTMSRAAAGGR